jgi:excisionase family DNA binding protein
VAADDVGLADAAAELGVHYMTLYRYVRTGRLRATRDGREWRVARRDLRRLTEVQPTRGRRAAPGRLRRRLADRMVAGDELGAWRIVEDALASGADPADLHLRVLVPVLADVGQRWAAGTLTVAEEHQASVVAGRIIGRLGPRLRAPGARRGTVVVGAVTGDTHALPTAIAADLLRAARYDVVDLGADVPAASFAATVRSSTRLRAVVVSVASLPAPSRLTKVCRAVRAEADVPVLVGGPACEPEIAARCGADACVTLDALVDEVLARSTEGPLPLS